MKTIYHQGVCHQTLSETGTTLPFSCISDGKYNDYSDVKWSVSSGSVQVYPVTESNVIKVTAIEAIKRQPFF